MEILNCKALSLVCLGGLFMTMSNLECQRKKSRPNTTHSDMQTTSSAVTEVTNKGDLEKAITDSGKTVVKFYAPWCGACQASDAPYKELAGDLSEVKFVQVNVDKSADLAKEYQVQGIPHFVLFQDGKKVDVKTGLSGGKEALKKFVA